MLTFRDHERAAATTRESAGYMPVKGTFPAAYHHARRAAAPAHGHPGPQAGPAPHPPGVSPQLVLTLIMYCSDKGIRSLRAVEMATFDDVGSRRRPP
jgi:hypothetical protein